MVSSITGFSAIAYLDQVKGVSKAAPVKPQPVAPENTETSSAPSSSLSPLQSSNALQLSSAVLSILQENGGSSGNSNSLAALFSSTSKSNDNNSVASLLDGSSSSSSNNLLSSFFSSTSDASENIFTTLLQNASTKSQPLQQAVNSALQAQADTKAQSSPVQSLLSSINSASNAYNKVLLQNAQNAINASNNKSLVA